MASQQCLQRFKAKSKFMGIPSYRGDGATSIIVTHFLAHNPGIPLTLEHNMKVGDFRIFFFNEACLKALSRLSSIRNL